jgi:hypothetical protein
MQISKAAVNQVGDVEGVRPDLNALEQLIDLLIRHLLTELGKYIS